MSLGVSESLRLSYGASEPEEGWKQFEFDLKKSELQALEEEQSERKKRKRTEKEKSRKKIQIRTEQTKIINSHLLESC